MKLSKQIELALLFTLCIVAVISNSSCVRFVDGRTGRPLGQSYGRQAPYGRPPGGPMGPMAYGGPQQGHMRPGQPGAQQGQGGGRSFNPYFEGQKPDGRVQTGQKKVQTGTKETKKFIGGFTVELWNSEDMALKAKAHTVTEKYFRDNNHTFPTDEYVSEQIGHQCRLVNKR